MPSFHSRVCQFAIAVALTVAFLWIATQWAASQLGYHPALGSSWIMLFGWPIYAPWKLFAWWLSFDAYAPDVFARAGAVAAFGGLASGGVALGGAAWRASQRKEMATYGSARWADVSDVSKAELLGDRGVVLGLYDRRYLRHDGEEHVLALAPTRSGKGVGLVVPTLLSWTGSAVVHDVKGENWQLTAGWRSRFSHCLLFDPTNPRSARFNPLMEVRKGPMEVRDAENIADILVDPAGAHEIHNHWQLTANDLLVGVILHVLYAEKEKTLARVASFLTDPSRSISRVAKIMLTTNHLGTDAEPKAHPVVAAVGRGLLNMAENERSGVVSTTMTSLSLYRDPLIAANTQASDWRIADLVTAERPVSLYLVVPPSDISRTRPLIRLILNQIGRRLTESLSGIDGEARRHKLLLMLDEFPALGRLDFFETALAYLAGYGVRAMLIAQSLHQIDKAYGHNNAILDNCHIRVAFAPNDERTAKRLSEALGTATELRAQRNFSGRRLAAFLSHTTISEQETPRPLLTPGEILQLSKNEALVLVAGTPPIRAKKLRYYEDRNFLARYHDAPQLGETPYADAPPARANDWAGQKSATHPELDHAWSDMVSAPAGDDDRPRVRSLAKPKVRKEHAPDLPLFAALETASGSTADDKTEPEPTPALGHVIEFPGGVRM